MSQLQEREYDIVVGEGLPHKDCKASHVLIRNWMVEPINGIHVIEYSKYEKVVALQRMATEATRQQIESMAHDTANALSRLRAESNLNKKLIEDLENISQSCVCEDIRNHDKHCQATLADKALASARPNLGV